MILHRRIAEAVHVKEVRALLEELKDRYGKPPAAVLRLLRLAELRVQAAQKKIGRIETRDNKVYFYRQRERSPLLCKGHIPALKGKDAEQKLASLFQTLQAL
jgi:transcription-repair coupling factor (superfamily II helicase)